MAALREDVAPSWMAEPLSLEDTAERYVRPALRQAFVELCRQPVSHYLDRCGAGCCVLVLGQRWLEHSVVCVCVCGWLDGQCCRCPCFSGPAGRAATLLTQRSAAAPCVAAGLASRATCCARCTP
jgi:hypothetical protein